MAFTKSFPKRTDKLSIPKWEEITLSEGEERQVEEEARLHNIALMKQCIDDARRMMIDKNLNQEILIVKAAIALFEKRASHSIYWKENKAREKL